MFEPGSIDATLSTITQQAASVEAPGATVRAEAARASIAECDAEISQYRASLKAGADPAVIGPWIAETQARKVAAQAEIRAASRRQQMGQEEIAAVITAFGDLAQVVQNADTQDKADIYAKLKLTLVYQPGERVVQAHMIKS